MPEVRYYLLKIVTNDEQGQQLEIPHLPDDPIRLSTTDRGEVSIDGDEPFSLNKLPELFGRLPDDRYRLYLFEDDAERLVLEFIIKEGRPVELPEASFEDEDGQQHENGQGVAPLQDEQDEQIDEDDARLDGPDQSKLLLPNSRSGIGTAVPPVAWESGVTTPATSPTSETFAEQLGEASFVSHAGLVVTAASLSLATGVGWEKRIDRLMARLGRRAPATEDLFSRRPQAISPNTGGERNTS